MVVAVVILTKASKGIVVAMDRRLCDRVARANASPSTRSVIAVADAVDVVSRDCALVSTHTGITMRAGRCLQFNV